MTFHEAFEALREAWIEYREEIIKALKLREILEWLESIFQKLK